MLPPLPRCSSWVYSSLISPSRNSLPRKGCRVGLHIVLFEDCSAFTRVAARTLAPSPICDLLHRRLQPSCYLHDFSGCFRLERLPGGARTHWKAPPCHGAHVKRTLAGSGPLLHRFLHRLTQSVLHFAGFRSGPGERQGDIVWDAVQIFNNLGTKPEPSRSKLALPTRVDLGRFAPQGRRPINFGNVDFATAVAAEVAGKSDEFEAAFALGRRRLGAIEQLGPHLLVEMFQPHRFDLSLALERRQLFGRSSVRPDGFLCDGHEFA